jgi:hypothetical protein
MQGIMGIIELDIETLDIETRNKFSKIQNHGTVLSMSVVKLIPHIKHLALQISPAGRCELTKH